ncbi:hypothetical protein [Rhodobacteraceae phage LS06-2018-MD06]|jgi:hypothetical protein|nr:hypothetical protein [Rhodobacteraceae phage LS06-2018-MD06]
MNITVKNYPIIPPKNTVYFICNSTTSMRMQLRKLVFYLKRQNRPFNVARRSVEDTRYSVLAVFMTETEAKFWMRNALGHREVFHERENEVMTVAQYCYFNDVIREDFGYDAEQVIADIKGLDK